MRRALIALALAITTVGCSREPRLRIGSKNFSEQYVLGEIIARHVENRLHIRISRHFGIGGAMLAQQALESGEIDLFPEYTGTALTAILKLPSEHDPAVVLQQLRQRYAPRGLAWMDPLGFENTYALAVRNDSTAAVTLSDAAREKPWRMGMGYEFAGSPDGLVGLKATYGLRLEGKAKTMDLGLLYQALGKKQVDLVAANSTDGMLSILALKVLQDDRHYFPPYECAIVVREQALGQFAGLRAALGELSGRISADNMRRLNYELDGKHRPAREIARGFLRSAGLER